MSASALLRSGERHQRACADTIEALDVAGVPFLLGGTFALAFHTGEPRTTKDLDVMVRRADLPSALDALARAGFATSLPFPHWLAKAQRDDFLVDVIFSSGNGVARVDEEWFQYASRAELFGRMLLISPAEELIWSKAFVMERERYDGADVAHLLWAKGRVLDWPRLERRFASLLPILLLHVLEFLFVYSDASERLPPGLFARLQSRALAELNRAGGRPVCRGALISRSQYLHDTQHRGYADGRLAIGAMSAEDVDLWTAAIDPSA